MADDDADDWEDLLDDDDGGGEGGTAEREESTMSHAPRQLFKEIDSVSVSGLINELDTNGVARMNNLLSIPQTVALLAFVNTQLAASLADVALGPNDKGKSFSNIKAGENRWDLKLPFSSIVQDTLKTLLHVDSMLGDVLLSLVSGCGIESCKCLFIPRLSDYLPHH